MSVCLFGWLSVAALCAQDVAALRGQVLDEAGAIIRSARVTLRAAKGRTLNTNTDANGEFSFANVSPGVYGLRVEANGFQVYSQTELRLTQTTAPLRIVLLVALVNVETEVRDETDELSVEPERNLSALVLDAQMVMSLLPDDEAEMRAYLEALAGPAAGGRARFIIDGFPDGRLPPREAILQIRINQNPFSAEYSAHGAGRIEIQTRPGSERWHASGGFGFSNAAFNARRANATTRPDLDQRRYVFTLSGPVIAKRLSFFLSAERRTIHSENTINARTLSGAFIANTPTLSANRVVGLRTGYAINQQHTLNFSFNEQRTQRESNGGDFALPERGVSFDNTNQTLTISETFLINTRLIHETRLRYQREVARQTARTASVAIIVPDAFSGGGDPCCPHTARQQRVDWQDYLTFSQRKHTLRGGFQLEYENNRNQSANNFNGTYFFVSLEQYRAALPTQFTINRGAPFVRHTQARAAWFVQDDWRVSQSLTLSAGLRHEFQRHLQDKVNFAPRFSLAWSPFRNRKTTIRAGSGVFFERLSGSLYENTLRYDGLTQRSVIIDNPVFIANFTPALPDPVAANSQVAARTNVRRVLEPKLRAPYALNLSASVERQLTRSLVTSVTYNTLRGVHLFRTRNVNAPLPGMSTRPDTTQGNLYQLESSASSRYHGLSAVLNRRFSSRFSLVANYTLSWTMSDADSASSLPANNYDLRAEWGRALSDRRHGLLVTGPVSLKYNIALMPFLQVNSGTPFNLTTGQDDNRDTTINDRPAGIRRNADLLVHHYAQLAAPLRDLLTANFPTGVRATGAGNVTVNLNTSKTFRFGRRAVTTTQNPPGNEASRFNLQLSVQVTNLFNHVNPGQFTGVLTSPFFYRSNRVGPARQMECNLRLSF